MRLYKFNYYRAIIVISIILLSNICFTNRAQAQDVDYKSYTLFMYNFMKYIEWPETSAKGDFVIGVFGDSPIIKELQVLAQTKKVRNKTIIVKKLSSIDEVENCQMIYIVESKSSLLKNILIKTKDKPILLVAEREGLAKKGAALNFITLDDDVLKFEINKRAMEQIRLKVPMILISLGLVVG